MDDKNKKKKNLVNPGIEYKLIKTIQIIGSNLKIIILPFKKRSATIIRPKILEKEFYQREKIEGLE